MRIPVKRLFLIILFSAFTPDANAAFDSCTPGNIIVSGEHPKRTLHSQVNPNMKGVRTHWTIDENNVIERKIVAKGMGNTADGNTENWDKAVIRVKEAFPKASIVVPSHGPPGPASLLDETISLAREHEKQP